MVITLTPEPIWIWCRKKSTPDRN